MALLSSASVEDFATRTSCAQQGVVRQRLSSTSGHEHRRARRTRRLRPCRCRVVRVRRLDRPVLPTRHLDEHAVGQADCPSPTVIATGPQPTRPACQISVDRERSRQAKLGQIEHRVLLVDADQSDQVVEHLGDAEHRERRQRSSASRRTTSGAAGSSFRKRTAKESRIVTAAGDARRRVVTQPAPLRCPALAPGTGRGALRSDPRAAVASRCGPRDRPPSLARRDIGRAPRPGSTPARSPRPSSRKTSRSPPPPGVV